MLSIYLDAELAKLRDRFKATEDDEDTIPGIRKFKKRIGSAKRLVGAKMLADVDGEQCRQYAKERGNKGGSRRDLEDLRAIIILRKATTEGLSRSPCLQRASLVTNG